LEKDEVKESAALRRQARSDIDAATALGGGGCPEAFRAHVAAKAQQGVEKIVKAAVVALLEGPKVKVGAVKNRTTNARAPREHHVRTFAWAISRVGDDLSSSKRHNNAIRRLAGAFPMVRRLVIAELDVLVPEWPSERNKQHASRNTEYPYEPSEPFDWVAPCDAFSAEEVVRFYENARAIVDEVDRLVAALELLYP
jgi:hypothetical protein